MSTHAHSSRHTVGFIILVVLAALLLLLVMRFVTPLRDEKHPTFVPSLPTTSSTMPTLPDPNDGKPANPSVQPSEPSDLPVVTSPVRSRPAGMICDELNYICINSPKENALIGNPFTITGSVAASGKTIRWNVEDGKNNFVIPPSLKRVTTNEGANNTTDFSLTVPWVMNPASPAGWLNVYYEEDRANNEVYTHELTIPVRFGSVGKVERKLYMLPANAQGSDCSEVVATTYALPDSRLPVEAALRALLFHPPGLALGADPASLPKTAIPQNTQLISLSVANGVAKVVFSKELENYGGGSCNVTAIRAQIEQTLKQFSSIRQVEISVEGKTAAESLQP